MNNRTLLFALADMLTCYPVCKTSAAVEGVTIQGYEHFFRWGASITKSEVTNQQCPLRPLERAGRTAKDVIQALFYKTLNDCCRNCRFSAEMRNTERRVEGCAKS